MGSADWVDAHTSSVTVAYESNNNIGTLRTCCLRMSVLREGSQVLAVISQVGCSTLLRSLGIML